MLVIICVCAACAVYAGWLFMLIIFEGWVDFLAMMACWLNLLICIASRYGCLAMLVGYLC